MFGLFLKIDFPRFIHILYFTVFVSTCSDIGGVTFSGMNCAEVVAQSPSNCYSDLVKLYCCGSCAAVSTGTPGKLNTIFSTFVFSTHSCFLVVEIKAESHFII